VWRSSGTAERDACDLRHQRRGTVEHLVVIHVDHCGATRIRRPGKGHVEQQTTTLGETAVTENLLMRNTKPILTSTAKIPRITQSNTRTSINTVNVLQGRGEDDTSGTDARGREHRIVDLDENVEPVEQRHVRHVDAKMGRSAVSHEGSEGRCQK